jgi:hypothetical protein
LSWDGLVEGSLTGGVGHVGPLVDRSALGVLRDVDELERVVGTTGDHVGGEGTGDAVLQVLTRDVGVVLPLHAILEGELPGLAAVGRRAGVRRQVGLDLGRDVLGA